MRLVIIISFLALNFNISLAQLDPIFNLYNYTPLMFNPAHAGFGEQNTATLALRGQWIGFEGAPVTGYASYDHYIHSLNSGIGINMILDYIGSTKNSSIGLPYTYKLQLKDSIQLNFGTEISLHNRVIDYSALQPFNGPDPSVPTGKENLFFLDFNFGVWLTMKNFYFATSVKHIGRTDINESSYTSVYGIQSYLTSGVKVKMSKELFWEPSVIIRMTSYYLSGEITNRFIYKNIYHFGISLSYEGEVIGMLGARINDQFELITAYAYPTNQLRPFTEGSLEMSMRYQFKTAKKSN